MYERIAKEKLGRIKEPTLYQGYPVSLFLGKIRSIRDCDAAQLFPRQLTSGEKKRRKIEKAHEKETLDPQPQPLLLPEMF
jgi:hypothetical protein